MIRVDVKPGRFLYQIDGSLLFGVSANDFLVGGYSKGFDRVARAVERSQSGWVGSAREDPVKHARQPDQVVSHLLLRQQSPLPFQPRSPFALLLHLRQSAVQEDDHHLSPVWYVALEPVEAHPISQVPSGRVDQAVSTDHGDCKISPSRIDAYSCASCLASHTVGLVCALK